MKPLISVVTVCLNAAATIEATIKSVLDQGILGLEYLIVDGGSTDGTLEILSKYHSDLVWTSEPDTGIYAAMNRGIGRARGKWIHLLNADDRYASPGVLSRALQQLHPNFLNYADIILETKDGDQRLRR